jgi:hypothetical protein
MSRALAGQDVLSLSEVTLGDVEALMVRARGEQAEAGEGEGGEGLTPVMITPDVARDTVEAMCKYRNYLDRCSSNMQHVVLELAPASAPAPPP